MSNRVMAGNETLSVISIDDSYINYFKVETDRLFRCHYQIGFYCNKIVVSDYDNLVRREYYTLHAENKITWTKAAIMCNKAVGGYLPTFENKNSLYQFLSLFRSFDVDDIVPPDAIYIGLILFTNKASDQLFTL